MATIMEDFIQTLDAEEILYKKLIEIAKRKTPIIVKGDIKALTEITDEEQLVVDRISAYEKRRQESLKDISIVLNKKLEDLTIPYIIELLEKQPKDRDVLAEVYERLKDTVVEMKRVNEQNRHLIELSLEMVEFDIDLVRSAKKAPETGDYTKRGGYASGGFSYGGMSGGFDAKQ